ncbi:MAG: hypothetical protein ABIC95_06075 [archaeon]
MNRKTRLFGIFLLIILMSGVVSAQGISVQMKRTSPGISGNAKPSELIYDVVNLDVGHKLTGFILCRSPDFTTISSSLGVASGSGAQYLSSTFELDEGPSQRAISLTFESMTAGDKEANCLLKYVFFKEEEASKFITVTDEEIVTRESKNLGGRIFTFEKATNFETNETEKILIIDNKKYALIGQIEIKLDDIQVVVDSVNEDSVNLKIKKTEEINEIKRFYRKLNGQYVETIDDSSYSVLRLDKSVPFVNAPKTADVSCPEAQTHCQSDEVEVSEFVGVNWYLRVGIGILAVVLILLIFILGRLSGRRD